MVKYIALELKDMFLNLLNNFAPNFKNVPQSVEGYRRIVKHGFDKIRATPFTILQKKSNTANGRDAYAITSFNEALANRTVGACEWIQYGKDSLSSTSARFIFLIYHACKSRTGPINASLRRDNNLLYYWLIFSSVHA